MDLEFVLLYLSRDPFEAVWMLRKVVCTCAWMRALFAQTERKRKDREAQLRTYYSCFPHPRIEGRFSTTSTSAANNEDLRQALNTCMQLSTSIAPGLFRCLLLRDAVDVSLYHHIFVFYACRTSDCLHYLVQGANAQRVILREHDSSYRTRWTGHVVSQYGMGCTTVFALSGERIGEVVRYDSVAKEIMWVCKGVRERVQC